MSYDNDPEIGILIASHVILTLRDKGGFMINRRSVILNPLMYGSKVGDRFPLILAVEGFAAAVA